MSAQPASTSFYVFLVVSVFCAVFSFLAGTVIIANSFEVNNLPSESMNAVYYSPLLIGCVGSIFGFIAKEKAKNNEAFVEQGCAANIAILSTAVILVAYVVVLIVISYFMAVALDY